MLKFILSMILIMSAVNAMAASPEAKKICGQAFEESIASTMNAPAIESYRMSKRVTIEQFESKSARYELYEYSANFYVKYSHNTQEKAELAGGRLIFDTKTSTCRSLSIGEFVKFAK
jgi:hypothetical protein